MADIHPRAFLRLRPARLHSLCLHQQVFVHNRLERQHGSAFGHHPLDLINYQPERRVAVDRELMCIEIELLALRYAYVQYACPRRLSPALKSAHSLGPLTQC
jgi:hypothetical protein